MLARVAASHIRVGTFQFFAARGDTEAVQAAGGLHHRAALSGRLDGGKPLCRAVSGGCGRAGRLIAQWMGLGFVHGVMNTDNMALSGETIDYGPCAFMEGYAPGTVFSSIDRAGALCLCQPAADSGLESGAAGRGVVAAV